MLYKDAEMKEVLDENNKIDFGIVDIGDSKDMTIFFKNDESVECHIEDITVNNDEVKVMPFQKTVSSGFTVPITFRFVPTLKISNSSATSIEIKKYYLYPL